MYYYCSVWSSDSIFAIIRIKIFIDILELVFIIGIRFTCQYYWIFPTMYIRKQSTPRIIFTFKINLSNRVSFTQILTFLSSPRSPLGQVSIFSRVFLVGVVGLGVLIWALIVRFVCAGSGSRGRGDARPPA